MPSPPKETSHLTQSGDADDFVHLLLGLASIGRCHRATGRICGASKSLGERLTAVCFDHHEVAAMTAMLAGSDFLRTPVLATARPEGFKEWHHFVIHGAGRRLLINFSLTSEPSRTGQLRLAPRVIVIDHEKRWTGAIERFDESDLDVSADLGTLTIGGNRMIVRPDGYQVVIDLPGQGIRGELQFTSVSRPFVVNNQPVGAGRMCWLFVPRLRADGWLRIGRSRNTAWTTKWPITTTTGAASGGATTSAGHGARSCPNNPRTLGRWSFCG